MVAESVAALVLVADAELGSELGSGTGPGEASELELDSDSVFPVATGSRPCHLGTNSQGVD